MRAKLYTFPISHPGLTARLMLEHKGVEVDVVDLLPGLHPLLLWARGYRSGTVPAVRFEDGRRVEGSLRISRALDELVPEAPLFPADPQRRAAVEAAERWGEEVMQQLPRRIIRYGIAHDTELRTWFAREVAHLPLPRVAAAVNVPVARLLAGRVGAGEAGVRAARAELPDALDRVDALLAEGTIGGEQRNAADFQIVTSVRLLAGVADLAPLLAGRPCDAWARTIVPQDFSTLPSSARIRSLTR